LTILALSTGCLLKVRLSLSLLQNSKIISVPWGGTPDILSAARHALIDWNHQIIPIFSEPPVLHAHMPSTMPAVAGKLRRRAEHRTRHAIRTREGPLFEAEAIDAEPDSELAADAMGVDVEDDAEGAAATADGRNDS
jgi:hypothetical protein